MNKLDFLKYFFNNDCYVTKAALQSLISIQFDDEDSSGLFKKEPGAIYIEGGKFKTIINNAVVELEGDITEPHSRMNDRYDFPADFHPVLKGKAVTSTFGLMLFNIVIFYEALGGLADYINTSFTKKIIEGVIDKFMVDDPEEGETVPVGKASVSQCMMITENCYFLEGLGNYFIKPGGLDTLTVDSSILERKKVLFEEHKDNLSDPVVFTAIVDELVEMDRKIQMSGPSKEFFIKDAFISNARKRMFIAFGIEPNPTFDKWIPITKSLDEGTDEELIVHYINTAVAGSYSRSMATGEGGSRVKEISRLVARAFIVTHLDDCGSPIYENILINKNTANSWIGTSHFTAKGLVKITEDNVDSLVGKTIMIRAPQLCTITDGNFCKTCLGDKLGKSGNMFTSEVTLIPTNFMLYEMSKTHTAGLSNVKIDMDLMIKD